MLKSNLHQLHRYLLSHFHISITMDPTSVLDSKMDEIVALFSTRMGEFEAALSRQINDPPPPTQTVKALAAEFTSFKNFALKTFSLFRDQIANLAHGHDRLETQSRCKILLFHGLAESEGENLKDQMQALLHDQMGLADADGSSLEVCHRLGNKTNKIRPVLVRFTSLKFRTAAWNAKTKLKGSKVSVKEFLTKPRQELFATARKHFGMKKCWTSDGTIVVLLPDGKRKKILAMDELRALQTQFPEVLSK